MIQIETHSAGAHGKTTKYQIVAMSHSGRSIIATLDSLEKAGCVLRFIHGANIRADEYDLAIKTIREIDEKNEREGKNESVSGETDHGVSDGNPSD